MDDNKVSVSLTLPQWQHIIALLISHSNIAGYFSASCSNDIIDIYENIAAEVNKSSGVLG